MQRWVQDEWRWLSYIVVFVLSFGLFLLYQATPVFADPDSFYHAKMALLIRDQGIIHSFPWLNLTTLGQHYTDQHFLYHVLLIPFETILPPLLGMKLATVFFAAGFMTVFYWFLRSFGVRWPFLFFLLLLLSRPLTFRMSLAKAPSTSLLLLFLGLAFVFRYQIKRAAVLAFCYVWYYGGFPLYLAMTGIYAVVSMIYNKIHRRPASHRIIEKITAIAGRVRHRSSLSKNWLIIGTVFLGLTLGVVLNPYFPDNLHFYWQQLVNIGIINFQDVIGVGQEWYPYGLVPLLTNTAFASLVLLLAIIAIIFRPKHITKQSISLLLMTIFFFLLTLKSRRYIEYYVPFAMAAGAFTISDAIRGASGHALFREIRRMMTESVWGKATMMLVVVYIAVGVGFIAGRDVVGNVHDLRGGFPLNQYEKIGAWMTKNTPAGSRVVHSDWDEFPSLFYQDSHNTYIAGLDPTFLYMANKDTYWTWVNITLGRYAGDVHKAIAEELGAQYVFVTHDHVAMRSLLLNDGRFTEVYRDSEATLYEVEATPAR
jgi:hypothetical protein